MLNPQDLQEIAITFDDVLLEPQYSEVVPSETNVETKLTRNITLNIPFMSAPMDTVTESKMAIALAREGGVGVIHKNLTIDRQAEEVAQVKRSANGVIRNPATVYVDATVDDVRKVMKDHNVSGVPVVEPDGRLAGIVTRRDLRFRDDGHMSVREVMTGREKLVTANDSAEDISLEKAKRILMEGKVEKLLLVDDAFRLTGLITIRDVDNSLRYPHACKDAQGRLRVGASVGVYNYDRIKRMVQEGADFLVVDSAHGHSKNVIETVKWIRSEFGDKIDVIAGNVATYEGSKALIEAGVDAVKVGIGPGSICTTRVISGVGVPQVSAVARAVAASQDSGRSVPIIADGGIRFSGDVVKALAAGAHCVMIGSLFAGLDESPGEPITFQGRKYKAYRGMGSLGAMNNGSADRYNQKGQEPGKLVPEGVEGRVPCKGPLEVYLYQLVGGVRSGMGYCGARTVEELRQKAKFVRISTATIRENHPHDVEITQEAPNYSAGSNH